MMIPRNKRDEKDWWDRDAGADHIRSATAVASNCVSSPFIKLSSLPTRSAIKGKIILDIGCGYGRTLIPLVKFKPKVAYGLDISPVMLKYCAKYAKQNRVKLRLINAALPRLPFKEYTIDFIYSSSVLLHLTKSDIPILLKEMRRVLRPEGKFYLECAFPNALSFNGASNWFPSLWKSKLLNRPIVPGMPKHYTLRELTALFNDSGLNYQIIPTGYQLIPTSINRFPLPHKANIKKFNSAFEGYIIKRHSRLADTIFPRFFDVEGSNSRFTH